jgi:catechol 2,3-dioxygenase-like lactoylglutathione lyase family enzyme
VDVPPGDRELLRHFLAAIAYRTQKALRGAPDHYPSFRAGNQVRTPVEILRHMTSLMGYTRTLFLGGSYPVSPDPLPTFPEEVERFHEMLQAVGDLLERGGPLREITEEQLLQGPLADTMTHVGQLALLRRLADSPIAPENFIFAHVSADRLGPDQAMPARPDKEWPQGPDQEARSSLQPITLEEMSMRIDHIFLLMPEGGETRAREYYRDLLGMAEEPVPEKLRDKAACWFRDGPCSIHMGIEADFRPHPRAHAALTVTDVEALGARLAVAGYEVRWDDQIPGVKRFHTVDPFGNRIEFIREDDALSRPYQ